ncbi:MAG: hypothetical protein JW839_09800 [Candidatus Lokiarchaeota archaeon]|nr:hypothetical protein [Candidatus Lokiarchaeota archaeon]
MHKRSERFTAWLAPSRRAATLASTFKLIRSVLLVDAACFFTIAIEYTLLPSLAGLIVLQQGFFTFLLAVFGLVSLLGAYFYDRIEVAGWNIALLAFSGLLYFVLFIYLNGPFSALAGTFFMVMFCLDLLAIGLTIALHISEWIRCIRGGRPRYLGHVDWSRKNPRAKQAALILTVVAMASIGIGCYFNWGIVITVKAPDGFKTTSSYWGPPSLSLADATVSTAPVDNNTLLVTPGTINMTLPNFVNGSLAYITGVNQSSPINYGNYSAGARSFPNGTIHLSQPLPSLGNVTVKFKYATNSRVLEYLGIGNSTLIMNHHSSSHPMYPNGYWYYNDDFFASVERTYLFQLLDYWGVHYYLNVHNGIDFPHVFNYPQTVPLCYTMIDWFVIQRALGLCSGFLGISPDFEGGDYEKIWYDGSSAVPLYPGSLLPDIIPEEEWYWLNCQNQTLFAEAAAAWEGVYDYASERGFGTYVVFQGGAMREVVDGDIDTTHLPTFPVTDNPTVRFGIMSYQDGQSDVQGGRFNQYRDCVDQIAIYGDRGRSILTGWIAADTRWYTDDELGLGRYIEDVLIAQAAGMTEIFHAPIYRLQGKWGDDAVLLLHQALNEWPKYEHKIVVPVWDYSADYMDAVKNFNHAWQFVPMMALMVFALLFPFIKRKPAS